MDFDDLHDLADDRPNDRPELSSPTVNKPTTRKRGGRYPGCAVLGEARE